MTTPASKRSRATGKENWLALLILTIVIAALVIVRVTVIRPWGIEQRPQVEVSSRNLIDECGVFMWVNWAGPDFEQMGM